MLSAAEILHGLTGVWRIVMRDPEARQHFNISLDGFYRSFWALAISVPVVFFSTTSLWRLAREMDPTDDTDFASFAVVQLGGTVFYWALYLAAMVLVARQLKLGAHYTAYVVTFNWGALFTSVLFALPLFLYSLGIAGARGSMVLTLPALGILAWYRWRIAREVLGAAPSATVAILILDFTLGVILDQGLAWIMYSGGNGAA
ncbi:MAG TPA: hypothetical protein VF449_11675 [Parvibaculum sp.]